MLNRTLFLERIASFLKDPVNDLNLTHIKSAIKEITIFLRIEGTLLLSHHEMSTAMASGGLLQRLTVWRIRLKNQWHKANAC